MPCRAVERWTPCALVGAYLYLALAYLLVVGATAAFFVSKILYLFGLSIPCCCDGQFAHPACWQTRLLLDLPTSRLVAVHRSFLSLFPFDPLLPTRASSPPSPDCRCAVRIPSEGGDSCCSASASCLHRPSRSLSLLATSSPSDDSFEDPEVRGNGVHLRRRHRSRLGNSHSDLEEPRTSSAERLIGGPWNSFDEEETKGLVEEDAVEEEKDFFSLIGDVGGVDEGRVISCLERELGDERGARVTLYLELEKERSAAATAADEAMAMILRLQREKAEIEMEARQYQRMVEEKSAYDLEEMEILKEIIVRREREMHVLEMEVEMYKQLVYTGEGAEQAFDSDENFLEEKMDSSSDNPIMLLQQIYKCFGTQDVGKGVGAESLQVLSKRGDGSNLGNPIQNFVDGGTHIELVGSGDKCNKGFQEKSMMKTWMQPSSSHILNPIHGEDSIMCNLNEHHETVFHKDMANRDVKVESERGTNDLNIPFEGLFAMGSNAADYRGSESSQTETESSVHDVHVINDGQVLEDHIQSKISPAKESSFSNLDEMELNIRRSCSEITNRIGLMDDLSVRTSYLNLRRSSMNSVDNERHKLENEVDFLRKRLHIIRQGREKLGLSAGHKEKETFQLQLLDEISCKLKELKNVTEPIKRERKSSLLPPSSKPKRQQS